MNDLNITTIGQVQQFLVGTKGVVFEVHSKAERYQWLQSTFNKFGYHRLCKSHKGILRSYIRKVTKYSEQQLTRLISKHSKTGRLVCKSYVRHKFVVRYTKNDILLLAHVDKLHDTLSGPATKKIFERAYNIYSQKEYEHLASISVAHIYNLRKSHIYLKKHQHFTKTKSTKSPIGERRKPNPNGEPGYIRIDTVHQGDLDKQKGVYHINAIDEVTQFEMVFTVEKISETYLIPILELLLESFPFKIINFHADNGSEYVNKVVAELLNKLFIKFTKSRARRSNDNALAESKNGAIVRKYIGYGYIAQKYAPIINQFNQDYLNPYINYHRPCFFPITTIDEKGKIKKFYNYKNMMTPYEKLKSLANAKQYLKAEIDFDSLDKIAYKINDNEAASKMQKARTKMFDEIYNLSKKSSRKVH